MKKSIWLYYAGWAAILSAVCMVSSILLSLIGFNPTESAPSTRPHSMYLDAFDILTAAFLLPVVLALYRVHKRTFPILSLLSIILIAPVTLVGIILHALLIFEVLFFSDVAYFFFYGLLVLSLWLLLIAYLSHRSHEPKHGLIMSILGATIIGYPVWAIWIGRLLLSGELTEE